MEAGPIFIGGPDRCGKTTMRGFLVSHPNISIPAVGSNMWTYFYGQFGDLGREENFERCLDAMLNYKHVAFLQPDPERIRREFWQGEPTYARLFALFQIHHAEREGKPRWGVQTGLIERYADKVFAAYPGAKMIHMIRDPRDRYEASLAAWPNGKGRAGGATARWRYSVGLGERNQRRYPGRYKLVRFESLVTETERTLREVCDFLGETYVPTMITMDGAPGYREKLVQKASRPLEACPLSDEFIGRYRDELPKREITFMQVHARQEMARYGYDPADLPFSLRDRLLYLLWDWPSNMVRMAAWRGLEALQHNFPGVIGRTPARAKLK